MQLWAQLRHGFLPIYHQQQQQQQQQQLLLLQIPIPPSPNNNTNTLRSSGMSLHFPIDVQFEQATAPFRDKNRLLVIKSIGYRVPCADFKQACREKMTSDALQPPAMHFFWQAADRDTHIKLHRGRVEVGFDHREPFLRAQTELRGWKFRGRQVEVEVASRRRWARKLLEGNPAGSTTPPPPPPPPSPSPAGIPSAAAARAAAVKTTASAAAAASAELAACAEALAAAQAKYATAVTAATVASAAYTAAVDAAAADAAAADAAAADAAATAAPAVPPVASTIVEEDYKIVSNADIAENATKIPALQCMNIDVTQERELEDWPSYDEVEEVEWY
ncbi:uncharacterized protein BBA_07947 [Beauveria bassiana ARSEF 2860]|uniref:Uncharacterized protein n=1 Tax=Beauveria bassiana (strain ARSEF 2860) TaxID=655819 RepID=J4UI75_BEAB2|nr:uncharacterized protein BBA_07947 [Beauveria bassiana ARSEF 2860]EJP63142.1 hypothetical protein BBA_07947 [Beauveria bassiana ARSEF 2860]